MSFKLTAFGIENTQLAVSLQGDLLNHPVLLQHVNGIEIQILDGPD